VRSASNGSTTDYVIDPYNETGYAQVFKEIGDGNTVYVIGHDVLAQASGSGAPKYLLYDGHGSVRHLADSAGGITDTFNYDAYGNAHGFNPAGAATKLLYAGEQYDSHLSQYYLRARYYDPANGRFNQMDPFAGSNHDPQSLHKYLYAHCNPIGNVDPSGELIGGITNLVTAVAIHVMLFGIKYGPTIAAGTFAVTKLTAAMLMATITYMALQELGVVPHNELVAEIGAILGYVLIAELFIITMLPPTWISPPQAQGRGMNNPVVSKAVDRGIQAHYDKTTNPARYNHEGCPTQIQERYPNTEFKFARLGQKGVDVTWIGGDHPSTYPGSTWPSSINQADFKPNTSTGNAFKLPPNTLRIPYDPQTGQIQH
jgi:RHS repeat-associated protein